MPNDASQEMQTHCKTALHILAHAHPHTHTVFFSRLPFLSHAFLFLSRSRDGNSMEVQVDIESKPGKLRHHSGSSSVDDGSHVGRCGWTCPSNGCASSEGKGTSAKWAKEASCSSSCSSGGKKSKGKLRKKGGGGTKINETREDMDAQLLEQRSTNSSEFDSPSLSGSLPSVADSHSSHFSEFSCSDLESMKTSCSHGSGGGDYHTRFATVSPLPEVENDRLETCPASSSSSQGQGAVITPHSPTSTTSSLGHGAEISPLCFITEENVNLVCPAELDSHSNTRELLKETNNNHHHQPQHPTQTQQQPKNSCIQTDIWNLNTLSAAQTLLLFNIFSSTKLTIIAYSLTCIFCYSLVKGDVLFWDLCPS